MANFTEFCKFANYCWDMNFQANQSGTNCDEALRNAVHEFLTTNPEFVGKENEVFSAIFHNQIFTAAQFKRYLVRGFKDRDLIINSVQDVMDRCNGGTNNNLFDYIERIKSLREAKANKDDNVSALLSNLYVEFPHACFIFIFRSFRFPLPVRLEIVPKFPRNIPYINDNIQPMKYYTAPKQINGKIHSKQAKKIRQTILLQYVTGEKAFYIKNSTNVNYYKFHNKNVSNPPVYEFLPNSEHYVLDVVVKDNVVYVLDIINLHGFDVSKSTFENRRNYLEKNMVECENFKLLPRMENIVDGTIIIDAESCYDFGKRRLIKVFDCSKPMKLEKIEGLTVYVNYADEIYSFKLQHGVSFIKSVIEKFGPEYEYIGNVSFNKTTRINKLTLARISSIIVRKGDFERILPIRGKTTLEELLAQDSVNMNDVSEAQLEAEISVAGDPSDDSGEETST